MIAVSPSVSALSAEHERMDSEDEMVTAPRGGVGGRVPELEGTPSSLANFSLVAIPHIAEAVAIRQVHQVLDRQPCDCELIV